VLTAKKRISKKEIKQDKLVTSYYKFYNYFLENQAKFLIGIAAVALIVVAVILISNKRANDNLTATNLLSKVIPLYDNGSYLNAVDGDPKNNIQGLKEIVGNYGSTEQGETAKIYLANCYVLLGKLDEAFEQFDDYSGSNSLFIAAAKAGKAAYYENKKEYEEFRDKVNKERREFEAMAYKRMEEQRKEMNQSRVISHVNKELDKHFKE